MNKNLTKLLNCYKGQCARASAQPCWLSQGRAHPQGVNLHGFFLSEIGLGESVRLLYHALATQDIHLAACSRDLGHRKNAPEFTDIISDDAPYGVAINVDSLIGMKGLRHQICRSKTNIAYPFWELDTIAPKYQGYLRRYDRLWAPSGFIAGVLEDHGFENVDLIKQPIQVPNQDPTFFDPKTKLNILFYFDFDSFPARKNPEAAIHAFKAAFGREQDVGLTIKTRGQNDHGRRDWLVRQVQDDPRIEVIDRLLTRDEMGQMMEAHDVFMSLHRSEGLGLGCAEALAAGKVVIATDYGGSTDFITAQTGFPVAWDRIAVGPEDYIMPEGATWADPSVEDAAAQLRSIYDDPDAARARARAGFGHLKTEHSFQAVGRKMSEILRKDGLLQV
ncbi:glycosyltransferase family 4 protein [Jannaschia sp. CCS1]|uniref:glycosyltransferase family 4 protein n=1 Tax=Jannaschia sp. (strain CCS1) TaxID=290400 RepID=UPI000053D411|nr:glycosyltransferase [Jannaschia sp. CCS1]ABD57195.1 glycosyl transferase group 1 [Jannaschia sp. CCS1]